MSEEMNRREAELSDAALNDVSGGIDGDIYMKAVRICSRCGYGVVRCQRNSDLFEYLKKNGIDSVGVQYSCPFYPW